MKYSIQIIYDFIGQNLPCIVIQLEDIKDKQNGIKKYYFNFPEPMQRFIKDNSISFTKKNTFFLTRLDEFSTSGLLGLLCTLFAGDRSEDIKIYGPIGTVEYLDSTKYLMLLNLFQYSVANLLDSNNNQKSILGFRNKADVEKLLTHEQFTSISQNISKYIRENFTNQDQITKNINDATKFLTPQGDKFFDENMEIIPVLIQLEQNINMDILIPSQTLSYICIPPVQLGNVNQDKIKALNIPKQQVGQLLKSGQITLQNGQIVKASDVRDEDIPSQIIIILDIPHINYIDKLKANTLFSKYYKGQLNKDKEVKLIIHMVPVEVIKNQEYQQWLLQFGQECEHFIANDKFKDDIDQNTLENIELRLYQRYNYTMEMNKFFPNNYANIMKTSIIQKFLNNNNQDYQHIKTLEFFDKVKKLYTFKPYHEFNLLPLKSYGYSVNLEVSKEKQKQQQQTKTSDQHLFQDKLVKLQPILQKLNEMQNQNQKQNDINYDITILGTGSMVPLQNRSVTAIYIRNKITNEGIIMDCGEGTYSQLLHQFGSEIIDDLLIKIRIIFISHIHLDHNMGILYFIKKREEVLQKYQINNKPIFLIIPYIMAPLIQSYSNFLTDLRKLSNIIFTQDLMKNSEFSFLQSNINPINQKVEINNQEEEKKQDLNQDIQQIKEKLQSLDLEQCSDYVHPDQDKILESFYPDREKNIIELKNQLLQQQIISLQLIPAIHCSQSFSISIVFKQNNLKVSYSGDTRPSPHFIELAKNSNVMIHETTYQDDQLVNAKNNKHSTIGEACQQGLKANAWRLVLTHFSQRYKSIALATEGISKSLWSQELQNYYDQNTVIASDNFCSSIQEYEYMPQVTKCADILLENN